MSLQCCCMQFAGMNLLSTSLVCSCIPSDQNANQGHHLVGGEVYGFRSPKDWLGTCYQPSSRAARTRRQCFQPAEPQPTEEKAWRGLKLAVPGSMTWNRV